MMPAIVGLVVANIAIMVAIRFIRRGRKPRSSVYRIMKHRDHRQSSPAYVTHTSMYRRMAANGDRSIVNHAIMQLGKTERERSQI